MFVAGPKEIQLFRKRKIVAQDLAQSQWNFLFKLLSRIWSLPFPSILQKSDKTCTYITVLQRKITSEYSCTLRVRERSHSQANPCVEPLAHLQMDPCATNKKMFNRKQFHFLPLQIRNEICHEFGVSL